MLTFTESLVKRDSDGALFVRYTPVLELIGPLLLLCGPCASGSLSFAFWEVGVGEPLAAHQTAKDKARKNAVDVLLRIAAGL